MMKGLLILLAKDILKDSAANVAVVRDSNIDWTVVRFPRLTDGSKTGKNRVGYLDNVSSG